MGSLRVLTKFMARAARVIALHLLRHSNSGGHPAGRTFVEALVAAGAPADHTVLEGKRPGGQQGFPVGAGKRNHDQTDHGDDDQARYTAAQRAQAAHRNARRALDRATTVGCRSGVAGAAGTLRAGAMPAVSPAYRRTIGHAAAGTGGIRPVRARLTEGEPAATPLPVGAVVGGHAAIGSRCTHEGPTSKACARTAWTAIRISRP